MPSYELVPVITAEIGDRTLNAVNARDLHAFLEVGRDFSTWIRSRIEEYGFVEEEDFSPVLGSKSEVCSPNPGSKNEVCSPNLASKSGSGGHNRIDYILTLDMAKELAMVERTAKGREVRQYFIECERAWRMVRRAAIGGRDILLETCLREAGRGNLYAMNTLVTLYGYPSDLIARQLEHLAVMRGKSPRQMPLPAMSGEV